jgi:hypothetical protein
MKFTVLALRVRFRITFRFNGNDVGGGYSYVGKDVHLCTALAPLCVGGSECSTAS